MTELTRHRQAAEHQRRITEQAASWYLDQREGMEEMQQAEFLAWLQLSPLHVSEYLAIARLHGDLGAAAALDPLDGSALSALAASEPAVVPLRPVARTTSPIATRPARRWQRWASQVAAAAVVLTLGAAASLQSPLRAWNSYASGPDELRSVDLPDGTRIQLDRGSLLTVRFDAHQRLVDVWQGGALFDVGHDPSRPLLVQLDANVLQDIGTVFDVHRSDDGAQVTVVSGRVKLWQCADVACSARLASTGKTPVADLSAGQQASVHLDGSLDLIDRQADLALSTAWLPTDIHFEHASVAEVARRFNAYSVRPLLIDDAEIGATRISGRFHARDMEAFITYLRTLPGVRVVRGATDIHVIGTRQLASAGPATVRKNSSK